jgi:hypothetical protein
MPTENVRGRVKCGDRIIFDDVEMVLVIVKGTPERLGSWRGGLTPPKTIDLMALEVCQIELTDGRKGDVWFNSVRVGGPATFQGTGPLTKPQ